MSRRAELANTSEKRRSGRWIRSLSAAFAVLLPAATLAMADDIKVSALTYFNNGGYTVKNLKLHWRNASGKEKEKKFGADRTLGNAFCYDLQVAAKDGDIDIGDGDVVWLSFNIAGGDRQQCELDNLMVYSSEKTAETINFISGGTTLNNNRCKRGAGKVVVGKDSGNCGGDSYLIYAGE